MKLRKLITVSAAALMLAGVGASATNTGAPVHASRRTVRMSTLRGKENHLNSQIHNDQLQIKQIKREMARLSKKSVKKGKRSKRNVKRNKRAKKSVKKNNAKKLTPQQQKLQKVMMAQAEKQRTLYHVAYGNKVYKVEMNGLGKVLSKKPYMSVRAYQRKTLKPRAKVATELNKMIKPAKGNKVALQKIESTPKFQKLYSTYHNLSLFVPKPVSTARK